MTQSFLVIGAESLVGQGLISALEQRGHHVFGSTRRKENLNNKNRIFLDFESKAPFVVPEGVDYAFVVAAATSYDRCEKDPLAYTINVELIPKLIQSLLSQNIFVTFISTNSVFGGERPWPSEDAPHAPNIAYSLQKSETEKRIKANASMLAAQDRLNVVRLTKILDLSTPPLPTWIQQWKAGKTAQPFSDLIFAPMSVSFVGQALAIIGEKGFQVTCIYLGRKILITQDLPIPWPGIWDSHRNWLANQPPQQKKAFISLLSQPTAD